MSAALGDLVVSLGANIAKFQEAMTRAEYLAKKSMGEVGNSASLANRALGALGVGLSVAGLVMFARNTINAADEIQKMSKKVGMSVEELSRFKYAADLAGVEISAVQTGFKKLAQEMTVANERTSQSGQVMRALGVDLKAGAMPALDKIADAFQRLPDGPTKSALAVKLFGRAGMDLIPLLNEGSAGIKKLKDEADRLGFTLSKETAEAAEKFNDNLTSVKASATGLAQSIFSELSPSLLRVTQAMKHAAEDSGILKALWVGLGGIAAEAMGLHDDEIKRASDKIKSLRGQISDMGIAGDKAAGLLAGTIKPVTGLEHRFIAINKQLEFTQILLRSFKGEFAQVEDAVSRRMGMPSAQGKGPTPGQNKEEEERLKRILADGEQLKYFEQQMAQARAALAVATAAAMGEVGKLTVSEKKLLDLRNDPTFKELPANRRKEIEDIYKQAASQESLNEETKRYIESLREIAALQADVDAFVGQMNESYNATITSLDRQVKLQQLEISLIGKTAVQREVERLQFEKLLALQAPMEAFQREEIARYYDKLIALAKVNDAMQQHFDSSMSMWSELADMGGELASVMIEDHEDLYDTLKRMGRQFMADMVRLFATKLILNLGAAFTSGGIAAALGNAAATAGQGTLAGGVLNSLGGFGGFGGSLLSGAGMGLFNAFGGTAVGNFGAGLAFAGQQGIFAGLSGGAGMLGAGNIAAGVGSMLPGIGLAIGAITLIMSLLKRPSSKKESGSFMGQFDASGDLVSELGGTEYSNHLEQGLKPMVVDLVKDLAGSYIRTARALGSTNPLALQFGMDVVTNPKGDSPTFVWSSVRDSSGNTILEQHNRNVARTEGAAEAEVSLQQGRSLVAALQETDLHDAIDALFDDAGDAAELTAEQIQKLLAQASELAMVLKGLESLDQGRFALGLDLEQLKEMAIEGETLTQTFQRIGGGWAQLVSQFASKETKLEAARTDLAGLWSDMGRSGDAIPQTREEFLDLMRGLDLTTDAGQELFARMLALAPAFNAVTEEAERLEEQLQSDLEAFDEFMSRNRPGYEQALNQGNMTSLIDQFQASNAWAEGMSNEEFLAQLRTIQREDFAGYDETTRALIMAILNLDETMSDTADSMQGGAIHQAYTDPTDFYGQLSGGFQQRFGGVIGGQGSLMDKLMLEHQLKGDEIGRVEARMAELRGQFGWTAERTPEWQALQKWLGELKNEVGFTLGNRTHTGSLQTDMVRLTELTGEHGDEKGEALFELEKWYEQQKAIIGTSQTGLLALEEIFAERRKEILEGSVDDMTEELERARESLRAFLDNLLVGNLSPLSPQEQLAAARAQFETTLSLAREGDVEAMAELQDAANTYLELAKQFFNSGADYTAIFRDVFNSIADVADAPDIDDPLLEVVPLNGRMASQADVRDVSLRVAELTTRIDSGISVMDPVLAQLIRDFMERTGQQGAFA